jgi:hypothetical protein
MAVDQGTGHIYIVYTDRPAQQTDTDVFVLKSADQGLTWNALGGTPQEPSYKRINQAPAGKDQWHAAITWDDTTGALVAVYFDSRGFPANDGVDTYLSASYDGGNTWQDLKLSDVARQRRIPEHRPGSESFSTRTHAGFRRRVVRFAPIRSLHFATGRLAVVTNCY